MGAFELTSDAEQTESAAPGSPLAKALANGGTEESRARRKDGDFFPTPSEVSTALLRAMPELSDCFVWEPHAGVGSLAEALKEAGAEVVATEKADRGYGETGVDFLTCSSRLPIDLERQAAIVMNPPFNQALPHIRRALSHLAPNGRASYVVSLLAGEFWTRKKHLALFAEAPPFRVMPCAWKPDFTGAGSGIFTVQWCAWRVGGGLATFQPLPRPARDLAPSLFEESAA